MNKRKHLPLALMLRPTYSNPTHSLLGKNQDVTFRQLSRAYAGSRAGMMQQNAAPKNLFLACDLQS